VKTLQVFIGFDSAETVAYHVLSHSILRHASVPVSITPIVRAQVDSLYTRPRSPLESTDFSMTRFLVPYLSNYEGHSLFLDCDMLCQDDISGLFVQGLAYPEKAVHVVQHDYTPKTTKKFLNQAQTPYQKKNWSSVMLFHNAKCRALTPDYVNTATGLALHQFQWLQEHEIGALSKEWNWLVGEYEPNDKAKILHYTLGTPCFADYAGCDQANLWHEEFERMRAPYAGL
jgi:lipopolysaccharide biosynthesis glycosyltransferase